MLQNSKGFSLLELLISLNIIFLLIFSLLPQFIHIEKQRYSINMINTANKLIQQELHVYMYDGGFKTTDIKNVDGTDYYISWDTIGEKMVEICVSWENSLNQSQERCGFGKR